MSFAQYYESIWLGRDRYFEIHQARFVESWAFLSDLTWIERDVLDVGGIGPLADFASKQFRTRVAETKSDLRRALPIADNSFDIILCTETIEHIKDIDSSDIRDLEAFNFSGVTGMLSEFRRIGRPNSMLFITTPNASSLITLHKWISDEALFMDPQHVREYTVRDLDQVCRAANYIPVRLETKDTWATTFGRPVARLKETLANAGYSIQDRGDNILGLFRNDKLVGPEN